MNHVMKLVLPAVLMTCVACGNLNSIHRDFDVSKGRGALIDIKQRAILVSGAGDRLVVCAEPSPDALSAYAAELSAQASEPDKISLALGVSTKEASSFVGLRTQSIQLLRDGFYRGCEAFLNKAISAPEYSFLVRRYQRFMVALLAIEQLTGAVTATASVGLSPPGSDGKPKPPGTPQSTDKKPEPTVTAVPGDGKAAAGTSPQDSMPPKLAASASENADPPVSVVTPTPHTPADKDSSGKGHGSTKQSNTPETKPPATAPAGVSSSDDSTGGGRIILAETVKEVGSIVREILNWDDKQGVCFAYLALPASERSDPLLSICANYLKSTFVKDGSPMQRR